MSYYEKRITELEARVAELTMQQRLKAIPIEAKLLERYALMQAENTRLRKAGDKMAEALTKNEMRYNGCTSPEAEGWYIAKDGGCP